MREAVESRRAFKLSLGPVSGAGVWRDEHVRPLGPKVLGCNLTAGGSCASEWQKARPYCRVDASILQAFFCSSSPLMRARAFVPTGSPPVASTRKIKLSTWVMSGEALLVLL